jgi:hypothetical protein
VAALVFLIATGFNRPVGEAEAFALIVILIASLIDLGGMVVERSFFKEALQKLLHDPQTT